MVKISPANAEATGDAGSIPGWGRSLGGRNGNLPQYSCLENPMVRRDWRVTFHGVSKSQTQLSDCACTQMPIRKQRFYAWPARDHRDEISSFPLKSMIPFFLPFPLRY